MYSDLISCSTEFGSYEEGNRYFRWIIKNLKEVGEATFDIQRVIGMYMLKFNLFHLLVEELKWSEKWETLEASQYNRFDMHTRRAYGGTWESPATGKSETIEVTHLTMWSS